MANFYEVLGVKHEATQAEIKTAYKKAAVKVHPDKQLNNPNAAEEFQHLNQAYTVLVDSEQRAQYDAQLEAAELEANKKQNAYQFYTRPASPKPQASKQTQENKSSEDNNTQTNAKPYTPFAERKKSNQEYASSNTRASFFDHASSYKRKSEPVYAGFFTQEEFLFQPNKIANKPFVHIIVSSPLVMIADLISNYMSKLDAMNRMRYNYWTEDDKHNSKRTGIFLKAPSETALNTFLIAASLEAMILSRTSLALRFPREESVNVESISISRPGF